LRLSAVGVPGFDVAATPATGDRDAEGSKLLALRFKLELELELRFELKSGFHFDGDLRFTPRSLWLSRSRSGIELDDDRLLTAPDPGTALIALLDVDSFAFIK